MFHRTGSDKVSLISKGEGDSTSKAPQNIDKIFANDRVAKFDSRGQLSFGRVSINSRTLDARIEWEDGYQEDLEKNSAGRVVLTSKIGVFDRKAVGFGSKVTNGSKTGTIREKRFFVTAALEQNPKLILDNIPIESLRRAGNSKKDDKIVYNNEWIGLVVDTRAKIFFIMDKDGKAGTVIDDNYGSQFPHPGEKIGMSLTYLWDAEWDKDYWFWNLLKYLGNSATIQRAEIDCMTIAWMGRIDDDGKKKTEAPKPPPNVLRNDQVGSVEYLQGRNWKYVREHGVWEYEVQKGDSPITHDEWVKKVSDNTFFGLNDKSIDMDIIGQQPIEIDGSESSGKGLEPGSRIYLKVVVWRSVVDVDWDDGTFETLPVFAVKPHHVMNIVPVVEDLVAGDLVRDKRESSESPKYGYVFKILNNGVVKVKWVTPNPHGGLPAVSPLSDVSKFDLGLKKEYLYLRCLSNLPTVVPTHGKVSADGVRLGIAVGINIIETKIVVRCTDGMDRLVWAHDFRHYQWDVIHDCCENKWVTWVDPGKNQNGNDDLEYMDTTDKENCDPSVLCLTTSEDEASRPAFRHIDIWPENNFFATEEFAPRIFEAKFQFALEKEFKLFNTGLPTGIWIEVYRCRADLLTAVLQGPEGTPYQDYLLMFDFQLLHNFPLSLPSIYFHSYGLTVNPCLSLEGIVTVPNICKNESRLDAQSSIILDTLLHIRDHILVPDPYYLMHSDKAKWKEDNSTEYRNFVTLSMLEHAESVLKNPPKNWESFFRKYYSEALPRIISRHDQIIAEDDKSCGDDPETPTGCAFSLGLRSRLDKLRTYLPSSTSASESNK